MTWIEQRKEFIETHTDCPTAEPIQRLDLIMKREWAEKILSGTKKVEFRDYTDYYCKRLFDSKVIAYIENNKSNEAIKAQIGNFVNPLRRVNSIHFHNYNNTWFLDVEVTHNDFMRITKADVDFLRNKFGSYDCNEELKYYESKRVSEKQRPVYFYFVLGDIIDTNLK